jgi:hypothetical protein
MVYANAITIARHTSSLWRRSSKAMTQLGTGHPAPLDVVRVCLCVLCVNGREMDILLVLTHLGAAIGGIIIGLAMRHRRRT